MRFPVFFGPAQAGFPPLGHAASQLWIRAVSLLEKVQHANLC